MSRGGTKINRHSDLSEREGNVAGWIKEFAKNQDKKDKSKKPQTAVEAARARNAQSFLNQIVSIMGKPQRYATVEDGVKDMAERTGLEVYLDKVKEADSKKKVNKQASDDRYFDLGENDGRFDLGQDGFGTDILASIRAHKDPIPSDKYINYTLGYINGSNMDIDTAKKEVQVILEHIKHVKQANLQLPESLLKYTGVSEDLENFIRNNIRNGHALAATIPQVQHDLLSIFGLRHGIEAQDVMNEEVAQYISNVILSEQSQLGPEQRHPNIGNGVGRDDIDFDNQNIWDALMPQK